MHVRQVFRVALGLSLMPLLGCQRFNPPQSQPNGKLAFYIAPERASLSKSTLAKQLQRLKAGQVGSPHQSPAQATAGPSPRYLWLPVKFPTVWVKSVATGQYHGKRYMLVSNAPGERMIPRGGKQGWGLAEVREGRGVTGLPTVVFTLNRQGAQQMETLTGPNVNKILAIAVDGQVVGVATIMSRISANGDFPGPFSSHQVASLIRILKSGMGP